MIFGQLDFYSPWLSFSWSLLDCGRILKTDVRIQRFLLWWAGCCLKTISHRPIEERRFMGPFFTPPQVTRLKINFCLSTPRMDQSAKKKVERSRRVFWQLHAIFWTTIVEAPIIFVIKIFFSMWEGVFFYCCCVIWFDTLFSSQWGFDEPILL